MNKKFQALFILIASVLLLVPSLGMLVAPPTRSAENRELAPAPVLVSEDGLNLNVLSDAGAWFEDRFAWKNEMVSLASKFKRKLLGESATEKVIVGSDGWLYYQGAVLDYQRRARMTDRALYNSAHNLALMQEYILSKGSRFLFCIAPDKPELYPEYLPTYVREGAGECNWMLLKPLLDERGVHYVDLHQVLTDAANNSEEPLYYLRDSHWTEEGARIAYDAMLTEIDWPHDDYSTSARVESLHAGDLDSMLDPLGATGELGTHLTSTDAFEYRGEADNPEYASIETVSTNPEASGSLLMFRDSFGNALLSMMATQFSEAYFSKMMPYYLGRLESTPADVVLIERTERHIQSFASTPAYIPAPMRDVNVTAAGDAGNAASMVYAVNGPYLQVEGSVSEDVFPMGSKVYVELSKPGVSRVCYEAYLVSEESQLIADDESSSASSGMIEGDTGYRAYIPLQGNETVSGGFTIRVLVEHEGSLDVVHMRAVDSLDAQ